MSTKAAREQISQVMQLHGNKLHETKYHNCYAAVWQQSCMTTSITIVTQHKEADLFANPIINTPLTDIFLTFYVNTLLGYKEANILVRYQRNLIYKACITSELCYCRLRSRKQTSTRGGMVADNFEADSGKFIINFNAFSYYFKYGGKLYESIVSTISEVVYHQH